MLALMNMYLSLLMATLLNVRLCVNVIKKFEQHTNSSRGQN